jgi:DNA end-binding protein Ku
MRYAEELVDTSEFHFPVAKDVRKPELEMARTLVKNLADTWDPTQYTDEYRQNLMKIIKAKLKGTSPRLVEHVEPKNAEVVDLMERLRQSLQGAGGAARSRKTARTSHARKSAAGSRKHRAA